MDIKTICSDCNKYIEKMDSDVVDLVITSPPYNVKLGDLTGRTQPDLLSQTSYDIYSDDMEHSQYISWLEKTFKNIYRVMSPGGRVCINIGDGKNGRVPTHVDISSFMVNKLGYIPFTTIIWNKNQVTSRCSWGSYLSPSSPCFPSPFEYILIFSKESRKLQKPGEADISKEDFIKWAYAMWSFSASQTKKMKIGHPAPFPEELPYRLIKMLSWKKSLVMDPFMGAGTTGVVCKKIGRDFIGIDISQKYCDLAQKRIDKVENEIF